MGGYIAGDFLASNLPSTNEGWSLNTIYQNTTGRQIWVVMHVKITSSLTLLAGQNGTVTLQIDSTSPPTTIHAQGDGSSTGTVVIGVAINDITTASLIGRVPRNSYFRFATSGTSTFTISSQRQLQE